MSSSDGKIGIPIVKKLTANRDFIIQSSEIARSANFPSGLFLFAHIVLGFVLQQFPALSTLHAYAAILLGIVWALSKPSLFTAHAASYIVGAEVLWRMTGASVPYEIGKYAIILLMGLSLLHYRQKRIPMAPLIYFVLLLPSTLMTLDAVDLSAARDQISFNLSGPLALFVSIWFFSQMRISLAQLSQMLVTLIAPIATTASYTILVTTSLEQIRWANDSMVATSGGFGPNQVSTIMSLGISTVWIVLLIWKAHKFARYALVILGIIFLIQGLLTFSRGGMLAAVVILCFATLHFVSSAQQRSRLVLLMFIIFPLLVFLLLPALNEFTGGLLESRFSDTNLTHRDTILQEELNLFKQNLIAGVGPGMGTAARGGAAHTEFTRLLAEHGLMGGVSLLILLFSAMHRYLTAKMRSYRGLYGSWILWSLLVMTNAAMRLAAISFMYGLAFIQIDIDDHI